MGISFSESSFLQSEGDSLRFMAGGFNNLNGLIYIIVTAGHYALPQVDYRGGDIRKQL